MPRRRLRRGSPSQLPPLLVVLVHPLRMKNLREHRFDLPSATEPHLKFEQARVLGREAAEHLGGGCDLLGLRSEPPLIARATDCKRMVQLRHGPPPFCGAEPSLPNRCRRRRAARHLQDAKLGRSVHTVVGWSRATAMMGPPEDEGGHGPQRTRRIPKRYPHYANGTASRPQRCPFRATGAFSRRKGAAASGGS